MLYMENNPAFQKLGTLLLAEWRKGLDLSIQLTEVPPPEASVQG